MSDYEATTRITAEALDEVLSDFEARWMEYMLREVREAMPAKIHLLSMFEEASAVMLNSGLVIDVSKCSPETRAEIQRLIAADPQGAR